MKWCRVAKVGEGGGDKDVGVAEVWGRGRLTLGLTRFYYYY